MEKLLVAGDIGGHRELIQGCETGVLFQAGNLESLAQTRQELLRNPDPVQQLVKRGNAWVSQQRSWEKIVR